MPLSAIRGTENRAGDFDAAFHPLLPEMRLRWVQVALAYLQGRGLPPVELIRLGDACNVRDGHHRVPVAQACQHLTIPASLTNWKVKEESPVLKLNAAPVSPPLSGNLPPAGRKRPGYT